MRKSVFIITILISFIIFGCGKKQSITDQMPKKDSSLQNTEINKTDNKEVISAGDKSNLSSDGLKDIKYDVKEFESKLKFDASIVSGVQWKDKSGLNVLIITETEPIQNKTNEYDESVSKKLFGYAFVKNEEDKFQQVWMIQDFIDKCQVDLTLNYIPKSLTVTDLNNNGIAENTFIYKMSCKGDVSPNDLKLIMHEGKEKYAIRGETVLKIQNEKPYGGKTNIDKSFDNAPKEFLDYAKKEWKKFQEEKLN